MPENARDLSDNIGQNAVFQPRYLVLQHELPLLQTLDCDLVERRTFGNAANRIVEIAMFEAQLF